MRAGLSVAARHRGLAPIGTDCRRSCRRTTLRPCLEFTQSLRQLLRIDPRPGGLRSLFIGIVFTTCHAERCKIV